MSGPAPPPRLLRTRAPARARKAVWALTVLLASCGPGHLLLTDSKYRAYEEIYRQTQSKVGLEELERLIEDVPEKESIGIASQELPFPFLEVWSKLRHEHLRRVNPDVVHAKHQQGYVVTDFFLAAWLTSVAAWDRLFIKLIPTEYGTTVVHYGVLRRLEHEERRDQSTGEWVPVLLAASNEAITRTVEKIAERDHAFEVAVVALSDLASQLDPKGSTATLAARVEALREEHRLTSTAPSSLDLTATFDDSDALLPNGVIDPGESGRFRLTLTNVGRGTGFALRVHTEEAGDALGLPVETAVGDLEPGATREVSLPFKAGTDLGPGSLTVTFQAVEKRDYRSAPVELVVPVAPLVRPGLRITSVRIDDRAEGDGDERLGSGESAVLEVEVENAGPGPAAGVTLSGAADEPGVTIGKSPVEIGSIPPSGTAVGRLPVAVSPIAPADRFELQVTARDGRGADVAQADWTRSLPITRRFPLLEVSHRLYDGDSATSRGNRDGVVNNGEAAELEIRIANRGRLVAEAVQAEIELSPAEVSARPGMVDIGDLPPLAEGSVHRIRLDVPRRLDPPGTLRATVEVSQSHFPPVRHPVDLPFSRRTPDLRVSPRTLAGVGPGRPESRELLVQNVGGLSAEGVRVRVQSGDPRLELLDPSGAPIPEVVLVRDSLDLDSPALRIPLRLLAKGDLEAEAAELRVEVHQDDFAPVARPVRVEVEARQARRVEVAPPPGPTRGPEGPPDDRTGPEIWILEPGAEAHRGGVEADLTVSSPQLRVRGTVSDPSGVYRVTVAGEPVSVDRHGTFTTWVRLGFGESSVRVTAEDVQGNISTDSFTVVRRGDSGRPRADRALLFATDRYDHWEHLENPIADARTLAATLEASFGFETEILPNPTEVDVRRALRRYAAMEPGPQDQLLVFFAGHGHFDDLNGAGYLVTSESRRGDDLGQSYLAFSELAHLLDNLPHRHLLVVLDACYGGTFDQRLSRARGAEEGQKGWTDRQIEEKLETRSRLYLAAGGKERVEDGPAGAHSPFMRRLLAALQRSAAEDYPLSSRGLFALMDVPSPLDPEPRGGEFGGHEPGGEFLFIAKRRQ